MTARGLVVDISCHHRRCCCRRRCASRCICLGRLPWGSCHQHMLLLLNSSCTCVQWLINSLCACARWLMDSSCACAWLLMESSCACAWWLIACIVVCCRRRTITQSVKWSSCAWAWVAWCWHMMLPQPICFHCCRRVMRYDNMVCLHTISRCLLSLLCDTDSKQKEGGCWQHMLLLHPRWCRRCCYMTLVVIKTSRRLCLWANRVVVILSPSHPVDCCLSLRWLTIYETLVHLHMSS